MDELHGRFLQAIYVAQDAIGRADAKDIAERLGMDIINVKADRDLYQDTILELRDSGYLECSAYNYGLPCGIVRLTESGLTYVIP